MFIGGLEKHPRAGLSTLACNAKIRERSVWVVWAIVECIQKRRSLVDQHLYDLLVQAHNFLFTEESAGNDCLVTDNDQTVAMRVQLPEGIRDAFQNSNVKRLCYQSLVFDEHSITIKKDSPALHA